MNSCKDIFEAFREVNCVERLFRWSHVQQSKSQQETEVLIALEPMATNIKTDIQKPEQESENSPTPSDKVACPNPKKIILWKN